jgi:alkanesulfonate monooxygenase SsuD/methylene tetrahydromethanopterin reductase-like flavin-dependent oxidoreductase (luciferase family)
MRPATTGLLTGSWPLGMPADPAKFYRQLPSIVEDIGFDSVFVGDHLFAAGPNLDALAHAADLAARTESVLVGTGVLQLGLREPVAAAKQVATIDCLSGGRFILGVGAGGEFADEWAAADVSRADRGRRLDEYLALAKQLWSGQVVAHAGEFRTVRDVMGSPLPSRPGGPPVWVGGRSDAALQRASRHDGWIAYASSIRRIRASLDRLDELLGGRPKTFRIAAVIWTYVSTDVAAARAGIDQVLSTRYRQDFDHLIDAFCAIGSIDAIQERVQQFRDAGVTDVLLCPQCPAEEFLGQVEAMRGLARASAAGS